ncbi:hypothetical protein ACCQ41_02825 [Anaerococcus sp. ENR0831]|uniref:Uncharacterized protein n=1 Tax=Anaerococcus martiniensis TaxID=3115615 RepID=A0ABW9M761_9FIRM
MKKSLKVAIITSLLLVPTTVVKAENTDNIVPISSENKMELKEYIFQILSIDENENVKLVYVGQVDGNSFSKNLKDNVKLTIPKLYFDEEVNEKDRILLKSNKNPEDLNELEISKDDLSLYEKYKKPENREVDKVPEDATVGTFVVKEVNNEANTPTAVLIDENNPRIEYVIDTDQLRDDDVKVNDRYKIYWNGIAFQSFPAKFGEIYRVEELESKKPDNDPTDEVPEDATIDEFTVKEVNKDGNKPSAILYSNSDKSSEYSITFEQLGDENVSEKDRYKIYWDGKVLSSNPAQFGKIYKVEKLENEETDKKKELAIKMYDSLVQSQAASILLEKAPKTVESIRDKLGDYMGKANGIMEYAYSVFLTEEEKKTGSRDSAIIKMMQYKYDKKLESPSDQELAKSIFLNTISANSGKKLLNDFPNLSKGISKELKANVEKSDEIINRALKNLK